MEQYYTDGGGVPVAQVRSVKDSKDRREDAGTESLGHIQSAHCLEQVDTARAAQNRCDGQLQHDINKFGSGKQHCGAQHARSRTVLWNIVGEAWLLNFEEV